MLVANYVDTMVPMGETSRGLLALGVTLLWTSTLLRLLMLLQLMLLLLILMPCNYMVKFPKS